MKVKAFLKVFKGKSVLKVFKGESLIIQNLTGISAETLADQELTNQIASIR